MWSNFLAVTAGIGAFLAYYIYTPFPKGVRQPWRLRIIGAVAKTVYILITITSKLGIGNQVNLLRKITDKPRLESANTEPKVKIRYEDFDGVPVVIFEPTSNSNDKRPGLLFFHGGGFFLGTAESHGPITIELVKQLEITVASVNYRRVPEYRYPTSLEDCVTATKYFFRHAKLFNVDANRIGVSGKSAGANLAAAVALKMRSYAEYPRLRVQALVYPVLQAFDFKLPAHQQNDNVPILNTAGVARALLEYLGEDTSMVHSMLLNNHISAATRASIYSTYVDPEMLPKVFTEKNYIKPPMSEGNTQISRKLEKKILDPYAFPLMASDLKNLPRTFVLTCEFDVARDEGILFAKRLEKANIKVEHCMIEGAGHGILNYIGVLDAAQEAMEEIIDYLQDNLVS